MNRSPILVQIIDNGGRRSGIDLRQFSYTDHIPERRAGSDRRGGRDRRSGMERRAFEERRSGTDTRKERFAGAQIIEMRGYEERRNSQDRRTAFG